MHKYLLTPFFNLIPWWISKLVGFLFLKSPYFKWKVNATATGVLSPRGLDLLELGLLTCFRNRAGLTRTSRTFEVFCHLWFGNTTTNGRLQIAIMSLTFRTPRCKIMSLQVQILQRKGEKEKELLITHCSSLFLVVEEHKCLCYSSFRNAHTTLNLWAGNSCGCCCQKSHYGPPSALGIEAVYSSQGTCWVAEPFVAATLLTRLVWIFFDLLHCVWSEAIVMAQRLLPFYWAVCIKGSSSQLQLMQI